MFDARSLLEQIVRGGGQSGQSRSPSAGQGGKSGGLGDILGQLGAAFGQQGDGRQQSGGGAGANQGGGGLGDILGRLGEAMGQGQPQTRNAAPTGDGGRTSSGGGLEDILKNIMPGGGGQSAGGQGGGLMDVLGQILGQATQGVKEGAGRVDSATGASGHLRDALSKATGKNPDELLTQLQDLIRNNQLGAGAAAGGLGAVILGTQAGRAVAGSALKIGALALIGGLAYKAVQNYQQGKPLIDRRDATTDSHSGTALLEAPRGSGFEANAVTNEIAAHYIKAMIAAAASDGRIDSAEQKRILSGLSQSSLGAEADEFLTNELNNPATVDQLVALAGSDAEAVQIYTAARIAIDLDTAEEHEFLTALASGLGLDDALVAHIDAEARAAA